MGCTASMVPPEPRDAGGGGAAGAGGVACRGADQLPLLQGVLVVSPGHRISAARSSQLPARAPLAPGPAAVPA